MSAGREALLALLAERRGFARPAEVHAAQAAVASHPHGSLSGELVRAGVLTDERSRELELCADRALQQAAGDVGRALEQVGLATAGRPPAGLGDDDDERTTVQPFADDDEHTAGKPFADDDEHTSVEPQPRSFGDDDERTSVDLGTDDDERTKLDPAPLPKR